jgi:hypothetical protein
MTSLRRSLLAVPLALGAVALAPARPDPPKEAAPGELLVASVDVARLWDHKAFVPVREARGSLEFAWMVQSLIGLTPAELERVAVVQSKAGGPIVVAVTGRKAVDPAAVAKTLTRTPRAAGPKPPVRAAFVAPGAEFPFVVPVNARTVMLAPTGVDVTELTRLTTVLADEPKHAIAIRLDVAAAKELLGDQLPAGLAMAKSVALTADVPDDKTAKVVMTITFPDATAAAKAVPVVAGLLKDVAKWAAEREKASVVGPGGEFAGPMFGGLDNAFKAARVTADGPRVVVSADLEPGDTVGRLLAAVPDSVLVAPGGSPGENNLKQILLALHNHESTYGRFPSNSYDKDGKPLLSWRVHILPFIEQQPLYQAFKLDEPWDSPHNLPLSQTVVKVFTVPGRPAEPGHTYFRGFIGPKDVKPEYRPWLIEGDSKGVSIVNITDGTSNTIVVVEAADSVPWSKPDDLRYNGVMPLPTLGGPTGLFLAGFADGSVRTMRRDRLNEKTLRALITIAGGEVVAIP